MAGTHAAAQKSSRLPSSHSSGRVSLGKLPVCLTPEHARRPPGGGLGTRPQLAFGFIQIHVQGGRQRPTRQTDSCVRRDGHIDVRVGQQRPARQNTRGNPRKGSQAVAHLDARRGRLGTRWPHGRSKRQTDSCARRASASPPPARPGGCPAPCAGRTAAAAAAPPAIASRQSLALRPTHHWNQLDTVGPVWHWQNRTSAQSSLPSLAGRIGVLGPIGQPYKGSYSSNEIRPSSKTFSNHT
jgi:hypothetical protein